MNKLIYNPLVFGVFLVFALMLFISLRQTADKSAESSRQLRQLETEIATDLEQLTLSQLEASRSAHPYVQERIARNQLLLQKPGEIVIELPPVTPQPTHTVITPTQTPWQAWQGLILK